MAIEGVSPSLNVLTLKCLSKEPRMRPTPAQFSNQLNWVSNPRMREEGRGLVALREANLREIGRQNEIENARVEAESNRILRSELYVRAISEFNTLSNEFRESLAASTIGDEVIRNGEMVHIEIGGAEIHLAHVTDHSEIAHWPGESCFDVIASSQISVLMPDTGRYRGRSHSLWYCDAHEEGQFGWFELAFMHSPLLGRVSLINPFALRPGHESGQALASATAKWQVAWPVQPVTETSGHEFINRWASCFADAIDRSLYSPSYMPEIPTEGTWRR